MITQNTLTSSIVQALKNGATGPLVASPGGGVHLDGAPANTPLPCVLVMCPEKDEQNAFFSGVSGGIDDMADWHMKVMVFQERKKGTVSAQTIFDAVITDLNNKFIAGKAVYVDETEGPTQANSEGAEFMVATLNITLAVQSA